MPTSLEHECYISRIKFPTSLKASKSVAEYLQIVKGIAVELAIIGAPMDEDDLTI